MDLIKEPCKDENVEATAPIDRPASRTQTKACDKDDNSFYHSARNQDEAYLTIKLGRTYFIENITVVNVHTGDYCENENTKEKCIKRLDRATVEILKGEIIVKLSAISHEVNFTSDRSWTKKQKS